MTPNALPPWYRTLNRAQWFVFAMASLAWLFDCFDQQIFVIARGSAMKSLLAAGQDPVEFGTLATAIFVAGWALGGLIFGSLGDRYGRARMLAAAVFVYSFCTGLTAFSHNFAEFAIYRLITGLGVGGVFGLAVALVADTLSDQARPHALGWLQALSGVGNVGAGLLAIVAGNAELGRFQPGNTWRILFAIGALPALLSVVAQMRLREPVKWQTARNRSGNSVKFGSYAELLGDPRWRGRAFIGVTLCISAVIGLWGIGFFSPELIRDVIGRALREEGVPLARQPADRDIWTGIAMVVQNIGAAGGVLFFTKMAARFGRKPAFAGAFLAAMVATILTFQFLDRRSQIFWMIPIMGFCQLAPFGGFAIYLPELFPIHLRSTGVSFCYNVGRFVAAAGPFFMGRLTTWFAHGAATPEAKLMAFRNACSWMSCIFLLGLLVLPFAPETKGKPLPEDA